MPEHQLADGRVALEDAGRERRWFLHREGGEKTIHTKKVVLGARTQDLSIARRESYQLS